MAAATHMCALGRPCIHYWDLELSDHKSSISTLTLLFSTLIVVGRASDCEELNQGHSRPARLMKPIVECPTVIDSTWMRQPVLSAVIEGQLQMGSTLFYLALRYMLRLRLATAGAAATNHMHM